jgi:hypothetical protein
MFCVGVKFGNAQTYLPVLLFLDTNDVRHQCLEAIWNFNKGGDPMTWFSAKGPQRNFQNPKASEPKMLSPVIIFF